MTRQFSPPASLLPLLTLIEALATDAGLASFIVGGSVRDALIGRAMRDIDIAVDRDAMAFARRLAGALEGHFVELDTDNAVARVVLADAPVGYIDVAQLQGTLEDDLRRRDFTIDALGAPITGGVVADATGGIDDLAQRRVRMVSAGGLDADPLRLLRGVRIAAELEFEIDATTAAAIRDRAATVRSAAAERRRDEIARIFALDDAHAALLMLDSLGLLDALLPEVALGRGVTQPGEFHAYDVFGHALHAVKALDEMLLALQPDATRERTGVIGAAVASTFAWCAADLRAYVAEEMSEGRTRGALLKIAGLLHDVAKPQTRSVDADGRVRFFGHADEGAKIASRVMRRYRFSAREARFVSLLVAEHLRPVQIAQVGERPTRRALYRFYRDLGDAVPAVLFLALADAAATRGPRLTSEGWSRHVRYMDSLLVRSKEDAGIVDPPRLLSGRDIMQEIGVPEGSRIGALLEALREAQAAGEVVGREAAIVFVRAQNEAIETEGGDPN